MILSIIGGALIAYIVHAFGHQNRLAMTVFQEIDKINSAPRVYYLLPELFGKYIANNYHNRRWVIERLNNLLEGRTDADLPKHQDERLEETLRLMGALTHHFPFPSDVDWNASDHWHYTTPRYPIFCRTLRDAAIWIATMHTVVWSVETSYLRSRQRLSESIKSSKWASSPPPLRDSVEAIPEEFGRSLRLAKRIVNRADARLREHDFYAARQVRRGTLLFGFVLFIATFVSGVVYPLLVPNPNRLIFIILPVLSYTLFFGYVFLRLAWRVL